MPTAKDIFLQKHAVLGSGGSRMGGRTLLALVSKWIKFQNTRISRIRPNLIFCIRPNLIFCIRPHRISGVAGFQISRISDKIPIRCTSLASEDVGKSTTSNIQLFIYAWNVWLIKRKQIFRPRDQPIGCHSFFYVRYILYISYTSYQCCGSKYIALGSGSGVFQEKNFLKKM